MEKKILNNIRIWKGLIFAILKKNVLRINLQTSKLALLLTERENDKYDQFPEQKYELEIFEEHFIMFYYSFLQSLKVFR